MGIGDGVGRHPQRAGPVRVRDNPAPVAPADEKKDGGQVLTRGKTRQGGEGLIIMRTSLSVSAACAVGMFVGLCGIVSPAEAVVVCQKNAKVKLRPSGCKGNEVLVVTLESAGPGPQGAAGPAGPQGTQGPAGLQGPRGVAGASAAEAAYATGTLTLPSLTADCAVAVCPAGHDIVSCGAGTDDLVETLVTASFPFRVPEDPGASAIASEDFCAACFVNLGFGSVGALARATCIPVSSSVTAASSTRSTTPSSAEVRKLLGRLVLMQ